MAQPKKQVRALHDRLKNPGETRVYIAKRLGLASSTLNSIFAKKDEIRQQIEKCGNARKKRKTGKESTFADWKLCSSPGISRQGHPIFQLMEPH